MNRNARNDKSAVFGAESCPYAPQSICKAEAENKTPPQAMPGGRRSVRYSDLFGNADLYLLSVKKCKEQVCFILFDFCNKFVFEQNL